ITFRDANLRSIRRAEDNARDSARDPRRIRARASRIQKLGPTRGANARAASDRRSNRRVALEHDDRSTWCRPRRLARGDQSSRATADDENIAMLEAHCITG